MIVFWCSWLEKSYKTKIIVWKESPKKKASLRSYHTDLQPIKNFLTELLNFYFSKLMLNFLLKLLLLLKLFHQVFIYICHKPKFPNWLLMRNPKWMSGIKAVTDTFLFEIFFEIMSLNHKQKYFFHWTEKLANQYCAPVP